MAGLSQKLTSLVKAADDPYVVFYAYTHLGVGVPPDGPSSGGFRGRVESLRNPLFVEWIRGQSPWGWMQKQKEQARREQQEIAELNRQEKQLALQLFQTSTLHAVARHLAGTKPEELHTHVGSKDAVVRFLTIQVIGARHLHLESELIQRLSDPDPAVAEAAHGALVRVARGTDFGPIPGSSLRSLDRSIEKWRAWLALQESASPDKRSKTARKRGKVAPLEMVPLILTPQERP